MLRQLLAGLALVASTAVATPSATAAAAPYVVYEAYAVKPNGPKHVPIRYYTQGSGPLLLSTIDLAPHDDGGYTARGWSMTYSSSHPGGASNLWDFDVEKGHRYLFAAPRGRVRFTSLSSFWRVKPTTVGFRVLTYAQSDTERNVAGTGMDRFRGASLPGGRYGSTFVSGFQCGNHVGSWSLTFGGTERQAGTCPLDEPGWHQAQTGGTWKLTGSVLGRPQSYPFLMTVFDHPKR